MALVSAVMASTAQRVVEGTEGEGLEGSAGRRWRPRSTFRCERRLMLIFIPLETTFSARDWTNFLFAMCTSKSFFSAS